MKKPFMDAEGNKFFMDVTTEQGDNDSHECTKDLFKEVLSDRLYSNYRVNFFLHKNSKDLVSNISTQPKSTYDNESYKVEYEKEMEVPDKSVYKDPTA